MLYPYRCDRCRGHTSSSTFAELGASIPDLCPHCGIGVLVRMAKPGAVHREFEAGFNESTGDYVSNPTDLSDQLKRGGERYWHELGDPSGYSPNFVPVDPRDRAAVGVTDEGLD